MTKEQIKTTRLGCAFYGCLGLVLVLVIFAAVFLGTFYFLYTTGRIELAPYLDNTPATFSSETIPLGEYPDLEKKFDLLKKDFVQGKEVTLQLTAPEINSLIVAHLPFQHPLFSKKDCKIVVEFPDDKCLIHFSVNVDADRGVLNAVMKRLFPGLKDTLGDVNYKFLNATFVVIPNINDAGEIIPNVSEIKLASDKKVNNDFSSITKFVNDALQPIFNKIQIKDFSIKNGVMTLTFNKKGDKKA